MVAREPDRRHRRNEGLRNSCPLDDEPGVKRDRERSHHSGSAAENAGALYVTVNLYAGARFDGGVFDARIRTVCHPPSAAVVASAGFAAPVTTIRDNSKPSG